MSLADLLTQTTLAEGVAGIPLRDADARLVALAPDAVRLLTDMAAQLGGVVTGYEKELAASFVPLHGVSVYVSAKEADLIGALLARFAELERKAAQ